MASFLITGGAGFIGSNIAHELLKQGHNVMVIDNFLTGNKENLAGIANKIKFVQGDICDLDLLKKVIVGVDYILHQAALPSVQRSLENPLATNKNNVEGTLNVLIAARDAKVKRVVYASSSSVYGKNLLPQKENMSPDPLSPYAVSKLAGEYYCKVFNNVFGLETVILRYFNVFGPRQNPKGEYAAVVPKFITAISQNKPPIIYGDGKQSRDFTFVDNVVSANILACSAKKAPGEIFNIACGKTITVNKLVDSINDILSKKIKPKYVSSRKGEIKHSFADISKAKKLLGYKVKYDFEAGLKKTVEWFSNV